MKIKRRLRYDYTKSPGEKNNGVSMTTPDVTLSLRELVNRGRRGLPIHGRTPVYMGDEVAELDMMKMDYFEKQSMMKELQEDMRDIEQRYKEGEAAKKKQAADEQIKKRQDAEKAAQAKRQAAGQQDAQQTALEAQQGAEQQPYP